MTEDNNVSCVYPALVRYFLLASLPTISKFHKNSQNCRYLPDKKLDWSELTMLVLHPSLKFIRNSDGECSDGETLKTF